MNTISYSTLEYDLVNFYNELYSGGLDKTFDKMRKKNPFERRTYNFTAFCCCRG